MKKSDIDRILGRSAKEKENTSRRDDDLNAASRVGLTALDVIGNVGKGAVKTLEGIYDEGATLVGAVGGIFDSDFKDDVAEHIKYDVTDKVFDSMGFDYVEDNSYLEGNKVGELTRGVSSGIGGMLPSVALGFIPGAGAVLAPVSMGVGAAGQATESALNKGAGYYGSAAYGVGMGLVEGATEALGGYMLGGGKSLIGKALAGTKLGKFTSKGIGKVAETFISEGFEESLTDLVDPALQYATGVDKNIGENYKEAIKGLPQTFLIGGTVGSVMQGGNVTMNALRNRNRGGFKATRADESFNYIKEVSKNYSKGKNNAKYDNAIEGALNDISRELTSMSPEARKNYMANMGAFKNAFNAEDGSIKMDLRANINKGAVSNGLRGISGVLVHKPVSADTEISEGASKAKTVVEKLLGEGANVVITSDSVENNALYNPDEGIVYINNNAEFKGEEIAEFVATHEVAHITEGTKEYLSLNKVLEEIATDQRAPSALKAKIGNIAKRQIEIGELYKEQMANMTPEQQAYLIRTELNADLVGTLLGEDYFIEKLAQRDASLVKKIFNHLKGLTKKSTTIDKGSAKYLNKLVGKFGKAIDKSQGGVKISQLGREDEETEQNEVENERKSVAKYDYTKSFAEQIEDYKNGKFPKNDTFIVGKTPDVLVKIGLSELPMTITQKHIDYALNGTKNIDHHIGDVIKQLPSALENPVAIIASQSSPKTSVVVIVSLQHQNNQIIAPIYVSGRGTANGLEIDSNAVTSVHARKNAISVLLQNAVKNETNGRVGLFYWNKKEAIKLMTSIGVTMPQTLSLADGFIHSIHEKGSPVNINVKKITETKQFKRFFGDWQNNPEGASKVVNTDGTPRVVYHGSNQEFSIFDLKMSGKNFGETSQGFFFFTNKKSAYPNSASDYAENASKKEGKPTIYECYLSIKKPLRLDSKGYYDTISYFDSNYDKIYMQYFWSDCDGVIIENSDKSADDGVLYLVDDSTQVKSATDNIGTFDKDNPDIRYSISKKGKFTPARYTQMQIAEELVNGYDNDTLSADDALRKLNALGYKTGINIGNALDTLDELIPEIREFATSEREAYRESNKRDKSLSQHVDNELLTEEDANKVAKESLDYWVNNGDFTHGSVKYIQNGKVKVKLAQTANEAHLVKYINNHIMDKKYSNKDVKNIIDDILTNSNIWGGDWESSYKGMLKGETMKNVKKMLWAALNTAPEGERMGPALDIADYIVKYGILAETVEVTEDVLRAHEILDALEPYKHNIDISHIRADIKSRYDKDNTPNMTWALKKDAKGRGYTADEVAQALEAIGIELSGDRGKLINEADIFIAIHELYKKAHTIIKEAAPQKINIAGAFSGEAAYQLKQNIAREILVSYDKYGQETTFTKVEKKYQKQIEGLKKQVKDVHEENRLKNAVLYEVQKIKDSKSGKYHNATQVQEQALSALKSLLGKIKYRSDINRSSTREIMKELAKWYTEDNPVLQNFAVDVNKRDSNEPSMSQSKGLYSPYIKSLIDLFLIEDIENGQSRTPIPTIEIKKDSELARRIESADYSKYDVIREYLIEKFYNEEFVLSDGKKAIMDKRDAQHLAHNATEERTAQLAEIKRIIETASYSHSALGVEHPKFSQFHYYDVSVKYGDETIDLWLNVGTAKNDGVNHIYAITNKKEEAPTNYGVARPVGNALQNASSVNSITGNDEIVKVAEEKRVQKAEKPLDVSELYVLNQILHHMNFVFESYGKIWRGGRWVEATDVASEQLNILKETRENETTVGRLLKQGYFNFFMDPELVCTRLDGHEKKGYFTTLLEDLRQADIKQRHDEMLALQRYDEFEKKHKKYIKELMSEKNTVKVGNVINPRAEGGPTADILEIPRYAALDLYMVSKTRGALETFAETGWVLRLDSNKEDFEKPQATITEAQIKGIEAQMSKEDLELIEIMEEQYNVNLRRLKYDTDMIRLGMSNVFDGYYYPINRIGANNLDSNDFFFDLERVSNSSFNNSRVKGAKQAIIVSNVLTKFKKHVNGVTRYANLSIPIENMTKLLNIDVGDNANMPQSITVFLHKTTDGKKAEGYIKTLIKDVQQINIQTDDSTKVVSFLRGAYAKSTLGFNPKVLFTQASSYIAGFGELRFSSLAYGIANIYKQKGLDVELDKYCPWAAVRHYEKGTTRAMTVTDKVNKFGDFFTKGIEFMDRQIVKLEFLACQKEAQARFNLKIGTEENKIKAGELLQELGLKTQQNQLTTEKSAAMRSPNEFAKTLTMFKADSMKQVSRFLQSISAISVLKKKMDAAKRSGDTAKYSALEVEYKKAQKSFCKYSAVIIASSVYMVLLARLFNKLYHKEEEDENKVLGFFEDLFGNICGMVPIISELYAFFVDGFEVNSFLYSTINNAMDAVKGTTELVSGIVNGENITSEDAMTKIRKLAYSIGALAGIPTKNVYKNTKAIVDIISPSFGDRVDSWFKEPSQKELEEKIKAGIEKGDDKAVSTSLSLLYDKYDLELKDNVLRQEYDRLMRLEMTKGEDDETKYSPLEAKIPDFIKIDDEEVELTRKDVNAFKNAFGEAEKSQARIVKTVTYKKLNDEQRAYALRKISQYYYEDTKYTYTGEKSNFAYYAKVVGVENLALILAYAKGLKGDEKTESQGRLKIQVNVRGAQTRRQKIEAYIKSLRLNSMQTSLALRCLGYGNKENDKQVISYVKKCYLLTENEKAELVKVLE